MKRHLWILAGVIFLAGTGATWALQGKSDETKSLNAALKSWETAFNRHDAEALGKLYAKDADAIDFYGETLPGHRQKLRQAAPSRGAAVEASAKLPTSPRAFRRVPRGVARLETEF